MLQLVQRAVPDAGERVALRSVVASFSLRIANLSLRFLIAVLLARLLGPAGYGAYSFALSIVMVMAIPVQLGLPVLVERETARAHAVADWPLINTLWRWSMRLAFGLSLALALLALLSLEALPGLFPGGVRPVILWGLALLPLFALSALRGAALRGLRRVAIGQLPETLVQPLSFLLLLGLLAWLWQLQPFAAMAAHVVAAALTFAVGAALLHRFRPAALSGAGLRAGCSRAWLGSAATLALVAGLQLINSEINVLMLGFVRGPQEVGIYRVAASAVVLVPLVLQVVSSVASPYFARYFIQGRSRELRALATRTSRAIAVFSVPLAALYLVWAEPLLRVCFGESYLASGQPLRYLVLGQAVNFLTGSVAALLVMTGHERVTLRGLFVATLLNVLLCTLWVPQHGVPGAAAALGISMACWNLVLWWAARKTLGIDSSPLGWHRDAPLPAAGD